MNKSSLKSVRYVEQLKNTSNSRKKLVKKTLSINTQLNGINYNKVKIIFRLGFTETLTTGLCACASTHAYAPMILKKQCVLIRSYTRPDYIQGTNFQ
jgi:hypothetical protein